MSLSLLLQWKTISKMQEMNTEVYESNESILDSFFFSIYLFHFYFTCDREIEFFFFHLF